MWCKKSLEYEFTVLWINDDVYESLLIDWCNGYMKDNQLKFVHYNIGTLWAIDLSKMPCRGRHLFFTGHYVTVIKSHIICIPH